MTKKIDLSFGIHEGMTTFPCAWHPLVEVSQMGRHGIENRETRKLVIGTHTGTHCDAPRHFIEGGQTVDQFELDTLIGPAMLVDLSSTRPKTAVGPQDLEKKLGNRRPERLVLRFDWCSRWGKNAYYSDHPYLSVEAAEWVASRGVKLLGMDTPMPDNPAHGRGNDPDSPNHKILLGQNVILVEYLSNLRAIGREEFELIVLPLKIVGGDGAPARCVAVVPD